MSFLSKWQQRPFLEPHSPSALRPTQPDVGKLHGRPAVGGPFLSAHRASPTSPTQRTPGVCQPCGCPRHAPLRPASGVFIPLELHFPQTRGTLSSCQIHSFKHFSGEVSSSEITTLKVTHFIVRPFAIKRPFRFSRESECIGLESQLLS